MRLARLGQLEKLDCRLDGQFAAIGQLRYLAREQLQ
jgi:hypothetical protein